MVTLVAHGPVLAPEVANAEHEAREFARRIRGVGFHAVTVDLHDQKSVTTPVFELEFETWDYAFRRGILAQPYSPTSRPPVELDLGPLMRADRVELVHSHGADGWIGGVERAIALASPQGASSVLADLADGFETFVTLGTRTGRRVVFRLHWSDGVILAQTRSGPAIEMQGGHLKVNGVTLPETVADSLVGQPLNAVFDSPFSCDTPIASCTNNQGSLDITLKPDPWLVDCAEGRMWRMGRRKPLLGDAVRTPR